MFPAASSVGVADGPGYVRPENECNRVKANHRWRVKAPTPFRLHPIAARRCAVKIARRIDGDTANRVDAIVAAGEAVERGFRPTRAGRRELINRAVTVATPFACRAVRLPALSKATPLYGKSPSLPPVKL